jgi:hypothetical protein
MEDDVRLKVQKYESNNKGGKRQPENPSQQGREFKSIQYRQAENGEVKEQADHRQGNAKKLGVGTGQDFVAAASHGAWHMNAPHDSQVKGIDHSQKGDDANRRRSLLHFDAGGAASIIAANSSTPVGSGFMSCPLTKKVGVPSTLAALPR